MHANQYNWLFQKVNRKKQKKIIKQNRKKELTNPKDAVYSMAMIERINILPSPLRESFLQILARSLPQGRWLFVFEE